MLTREWNSGIEVRGCHGGVLRVLSLLAWEFFLRKRRGEDLTDLEEAVAAE